MGKFKELNLEDTYRLVDIEGWINNYSGNKMLLNKYPEIIDGFKLDKIGDGFGIYKEDVVIGSSEHHFFEVEDNLWDGVSELEVGMTVKNSFDYKKEIKLLDGNICVLKGENGNLSICEIAKLKPAIKSEREQTFDKVLDVWKRQSLDYAYDTKSSTVNLGEFFEVMYDVMKGGK